MSATARFVRYTLVADLHMIYISICLLDNMIVSISTIVLFSLSLSLPHILVAEDDNTGSEVSEDANNEEESVKYGEGYESLQVNMTGAWDKII